MYIYEDLNADLNDQYNSIERKEKEDEERLLDRDRMFSSDKEIYHEFVTNFIVRKRFVTDTEIEVYLRREHVTLRDFDGEIFKKFHIVKAQKNFWAEDITFLEFRKLYPDIFPSENVKELLTYDEVSSWDAEKPAGFAVKYPWGYGVRAAVYHLKNLRGMPIPFTEFDTDNPERIRMCSFDLKFPYKIRGDREKEQEFLEVNYERVDMRYFTENTPEEVFRNARVNS